MKRGRINSLQDLMGSKSCWSKVTRGISGRIEMEIMENLQLLTITRQKYIHGVNS